MTGRPARRRHRNGPARRTRPLTDFPARSRSPTVRAVLPSVPRQSVSPAARRRSSPSLRPPCAPPGPPSAARVPALPDLGGGPLLLPAFRCPPPGAARCRPLLLLAVRAARRCSVAWSRCPRPGPRARRLPPAPWRPPSGPPPPRPRPPGRSPPASRRLLLPCPARCHSAAAPSASRPRPPSASRSAARRAPSGAAPGGCARPPARRREAVLARRPVAVLAARPLPGPPCRRPRRPPRSCRRADAPGRRPDLGRLARAARRRAPARFPAAAVSPSAGPAAGPGLVPAARAGPAPSASRRESAGRERRVDGGRGAGARPPGSRCCSPSPAARRRCRRPGPAGSRFPGIGSVACCVVLAAVVLGGGSPC